MDILSFLTIPKCVLLLVTVLLFYMLSKRPYSFFKNLNIPGPEPCILIGNIFGISWKGMAQFDNEVHQKYGSVTGHYIGSRPVLMVSDAEMAKEICVKKFPLFTNRYDVFPANKVSDKFLSFLQDDHWKFTRTTMLPLFSTRHFKHMMELRNKAAQNLEENFSLYADKCKDIEMKSVFSNYTVDLIATTAFGVEVNSQKNPEHKIIRSFERFFQVNFIDPISSIQATFPPILKVMNFFGIESNFEKTMREISEFARAIVESRIKDNTVRKDFIQLLLDAKFENIDQIDDDMKHELETLEYKNLKDWRTKRGLTNDEIISQMVLFLFGAHLTTSNTLSFFSYILATQPEIQQKVYEEVMEVVGDETPTYETLNKLQYLDQCMSEVLRMYPPSLRLQRNTKETVEINGWIIPKDTAVNVSIYVLHHDPKYWPEPHKFIPERFAPEAKDKINPYAYMPFGMGPRICIGIKAARLEFKLAIVSTLRKYKFVKSPKTEIPLKTGGQMFLYAQNGTWLRVEKR